MTAESIQATAENLRADFLNATSTAKRWKVLNRAIDWAVTASENAEHERAMRYEISDAMLATAKRQAAHTDAPTPFLCGIAGALAAGAR
jgi:hypothetical protein